MTPTRTLAASLARTVVDQIESSKSIITQNIEEAIHDALLLAEAKREPCEEPLERPEIETDFHKHVKFLFGPLIKTKPKPEPDPHWGSLLNWWQDDRRLKDDDE